MSVFKVEDPSNRNQAFDRVRIRDALHLYEHPPPSELAPPIPLEDFWRTFQHMQDVRDQIQRTVRGFLHRLVVTWNPLATGN
jgi:hypothetical protein